MRTSTEPGPPWDLGKTLGLLERFFPRLLSQIDRDPASPTHGSCDRGFWMYRLHDFDSGVLQQAGLTLACLSLLAREADLTDDTPRLRAADPDYLAGVALAVNRRNCELLADSGFLDEYYPGEQSYPGTVFTAYATLASANLLGQTEVLESEGLAATAQRLLAREPSPAANQDVAAAAFLALYAKLRNWRRGDVARHVRRLLAGPDGSGQCIEYGGGDLGYSSVSLNYLAYMARDESHDVGEQLEELAAFIADFVDTTGHLGGEYASRSTTYWLPFGMLIAGRRSPSLAGALARLDVVEDFDRLDDRYLMHYCLPSLAMTALEVARGGAPNGRPEPAKEWSARHHERRGLLALRGPAGNVFIGLVKGGAFVVDGASPTVDTGYRLTRSDEVYATAVIDEDPEIRVEPNDGGIEVVIRVGFRRYRPLVASPNKTMALRAARTLGPRLNEYFKKRLIKEAQLLEGPRLERRFELDFASGRLDVIDSVSGLSDTDTLEVSPPVSLRLVPSARFWQAGEAAAFAEVRSGQSESRRSFEIG